MMARDSITCDCAMVSSATCDFSHRVQTMMYVSEVRSDLSRVTVDHKMAVASFHCFPLALRGGLMT
jgi:4-hydroxy-3-methylbut-2-en-1-yl diphosphate synthase IspG/GcpE